MKSLFQPLNDKQRHFAERFVVGTFLFVPQLLFFDALAYGLQDFHKFMQATGYILGMFAMCVIHIQFVRPYFRNFPTLASYSKIFRAIVRGRCFTRFGLFWSIVEPRLWRSFYRWTFGLLLLMLGVGLYGILGHHLLWFLGMYLLTGFGVTIGFHRMGTHPSFKTYPWIRFMFFAFGCTANQGLPEEWMKKHSKHHAFAETSLDVHSPIVLDPTLIGVWKEQWNQFLYSWCMWALHEPSLRKLSHERSAEYEARLLSQTPDPSKLVYRECDANYWEGRNPKGEIVPGMSKSVKVARTWRDLVRVLVEMEKDTVLMFVSRPLIYFAFLVASFAIPYYLGGISFWESIARLALLSWATFAVNSVCHLWGERPFDTTDNSHNNAYVEIAALGEGSHNTHHKAARWAVHGIFPWQFDPSGKVILFLAKCKLAWDVQVPTRREIIRYWREERLRSER